MIHLKETGRNDPCPCGSGKKAKRCCMLDPTPQPAPSPTHRIDRVPIAIGWAEIANYIAHVDGQGWEHYDSITGREQLGSALEVHQRPPEPVLILFLRRREQAPAPRRDLV